MVWAILLFVAAVITVAVINRRRKQVQRDDIYPHW